MPSTTRLFAAGFIALWAGGASAQETQPYQHVYRAWIDVGGVFSDSTELHSFPGVGGSSKLTLNPGVRTGVGTDYSFTPYLSFGWEVSVLASTLDRASGLQEMDAVITQVPFLVNLAFRYENETGFTPFVGFGAGVASTAINVDEARSATATVQGSDYDFVFAWQASGGLKYQFRNGLELGVLYKYLWTGDATWELDDDSLVTGDRDLELDGIRSHAVLAFVSYRF